MAKLKAAQRNAMPASQFAGPGRSFPVPDASHAANAKGRATQQVKAGNMSPATAGKIDAKANKVLKASKPAPSMGAAKKMAAY